VFLGIVKLKAMKILFLSDKVLYLKNQYYFYHNKKH